MDDADAMVVVDRLNRAVETLRKLDLMQLAVTDRVHVASAQTDIIDSIHYFEAAGSCRPGSDWPKPGSVAAACGMGMA